MGKTISVVLLYLKDENKKINNFLLLLKKNIYILWCVLLTAIMSYGYQIANFAMSIDDERSFSRGVEVKSQLADGRYSCALVHAIFPHNTLPFWDDFVFMLLISFVSVCLAIAVYQLIQSQIAALIMAILFASMPIHAYSAMFSMECITMPLGYLCGIGSIYCIYEWTISQQFGKGVIAVIYLVLMLGFNQSFIPVYISYVCAVAALMSLRNSEYVFKIIIKAVFVLLSSLLIYYLFNNIVHIWIPDRGYINGYIMWGTENFGQILSQLMTILIKVNFYPVVNRGYNTLPILNIIWFIVLVLGIIKLKKKCTLFILGMVGLVFTNNIMFIALGGYISPRSCRAIPVFAGVTVCMLYFLLDKYFLKYIVILAACVLVIYQSATIVELHYMDYMRYTRDLAEVEKISCEIEKLGLGTIPDSPVAFVNVDDSLDGYWYSDNTFAISYFTLGMGRLQSFFERTGYPYQWCTEEELQAAQEAVESHNLPYWPMDGSVIDTGNMIIVNLGAK